MARWAFNLLAAISLVLCATTIVLWATWGEEKWTFFMARAEHPESSLTGFYFRLAGALVPYWLIVLITGLPPLAWLLMRPTLRRQQRRRLGLCPSCGYDLRATPDRCPECGWTIPPDFPRPTRLDY